MDDAKLAMERFCESYDGPFGRFEPDSENDAEFAMAEHTLKSRYVTGSSLMMFCGDDADGVYAEKIQFVEEKSRPGMMGTPVPLEITFGFDSEKGVINNFSKMGSEGGMCFIAARSGDVVMCAQLYMLKEHISEGDLEGFMEALRTSIL